MTTDTKICAMCGKRKKKSQYHKRSDKKCGVQSKCKKCTSEYKKKRYWGNRDEELKKLAISRNKPENIAQRKEYYRNNKEAYVIRYKRYSKVPDKIERKKYINAVRYAKLKDDPMYIAKRRAYVRDSDFKERSRKRHQTRKKADENYNIKRRLRCRLRHITRLPGVPKYMSVLALVGCTYSELKKHIQSQFTKGMTWKKLNSGDIHIDHIKPCALFNLKKLSEQKKCFHYSNLQPLWKHHNLSKGAKLNYVYQN